MKGLMKMGKVRHLTPEQKETHEKAVKLRKMTDEQLVAQVFVEQSAARRNTAAHFIDDLKAANILGIGKITVKKIEMFAREKGYI